MTSWHGNIFIKWKHFPRYWPFVQGPNRPPVNSSHKGQWRGALMFSLICPGASGWVNIRDVGNLRRHCAHYDVIAMVSSGVTCAVSLTLLYCWQYLGLLFVNTLRPRQNWRHFADGIVKCILLNENMWILLEYVPKFRINNITALVQIRAGRRPGDKLLSEPIMANLLTHICVGRPQWVKW